MPKAKWAGDLTADDIDSAETREGGYAGPIPPAGVYLMVLKRMKQGTSKSNSPKLEMIWEIAKKGKKDQTKFAGCPVFDHMPVSKETAFRSKALCAALGVSSKDFMNKTVVDEEGNVLKIGTLKIEVGKTTAFVNVKRDNDANYGERIVLGGGGGYLPKPEDEDGSDAEDDDDTEDGEESPF